MARYSAYKKIPGGKSVKVDVELGDDMVIRDIVISGDFFAYPEEELERLEEALKGRRVTEAPEIIMGFRGRVTLLGAGLEDIIELIKRIMEGLGGKV